MTQPESPDWEQRIQDVGLRRDPAAFAMLFTHFAPRIKSLMVRSGLGPDAAEEIAQETFVAVWRHAGGFDPGKASASAWIYAIARNKRIDRLRRAARAEPDPADPAFAADPADSAETALDARQRAEQVRRAIAGLPEAQRDVLVRSYFAGKTHIEIADELRAPVGTVKSRLRLALARMRAALEPDRTE